MFGETFNRFDLPERTLVNLILDGAQRYSGRDYLSFSGSTRGPILFDEVPAIVASVAGGLAERGIERGDVMALLLENSFEFVAASWGQAWLGGIAAPLHPTLRGEMLQRLLAHSGAKVVIAGPDGIAAVREIAASLPELRVLVAVDADTASLGPNITVVAWDELAAGPAVDAAPVRFSDPLMLMFTSGTTGRSKGVVIPHHYAYCWAMPLVDRLQWSTADHLSTPMPLYHIGAQTCALLPGLASGSRVTLGKRFSATGFWPEIVQSGATHTMVIGAMASILMSQSPSALERSHCLNTFWCAPPPVDPALIAERFGVHVIYQGYGMTEVYPVSVTLKQRPGPRDCVGRATELHDLRIVDEDDIEVPHDDTTPGEIVVRPRLPYSMMSEYWRDPEATATAFRNLWFHTGDLATMDSEGYLRLLGRKTDSIRRRGENISAFEIEQAVLEHPAVKHAAAYGVPSELGEQDVKVDVIVESRSAFDPEELVAFLAERLPRHMLPRYVQLRDFFPMTPTQRVEKHRLREEGTANVSLDRGDRPSSEPSRRTTAP